MSTIQDGGTGASTSHRIRSVLAIRPFRRLWGVTYLCSVGDWLSLLALTGLVSQMTESYQWQSFSLSLVVLTQLLPGILFAPLGGVLADRFDRRKVMVVCDVLRGGLFISIALVGTTWWLFVANFLVGCCAMLWIPAKDSAVPNLLRRPDQVETANQLGLVMTYGISVISGAGLYSIISGIPGYLHVQSSDLEFRIATIAVVVNGALYLTAAILVATRIPELSGRATAVNRRREDGEKLGFFAMLRDGMRYAGRTPLVRGLVIGMIGAFAAAGAVIGTAPLYADSLLGGASTFGLLFVAVFTGLAVGMATAPRMARRLPYDRLFGVTIVVAGLSLVVVAFAPHLWVALIAVGFVGASAGMAFLTGLTIVGAQVEDAMRGRTVALLQSLLKIVLFAASAAAPLLVSVVQKRTITVFNHPMQVDGTRPVLFGAALIAVLLGLIAYRQMDNRRTEPLFSDLLAALRGRARRTGGILIAVEGDTRQDTSVQARRLAEALRATGREVVLASDPDLDEQRLRNLLSTADLAGVRAHALVAAAVRADVVEREVRPGLERGALVVMERYVDSPLAHFSAAGSVEPREVEGLVDWATGRLRPDVTVLLDRSPSEVRASGGTLDTVEHHWRVQKLLTDMASADPERYIVVDADGTEDEVAERVSAVVLPLVARGAHPAPKPVAESS
ncbi:bifunctional MFS transporter/dTMP kinase [Saccharothrix hoggarensis]|uniref:Thymidylate kinase n=1 Tax=Saccharothrix hoggarensis TaxID=913853 RepID=A0ABW3R2L3_9PSEU